MFKKHITVREMFEARFPVPVYLRREGLKYRAIRPEFDSYLQRTYNGQWEGFLACYKMAAGIKAVNKFKHCRRQYGLSK